MSTERNDLQTALDAEREKVQTLRDERDRLAIRVAALEQQVENLENVILEMGEY